MKNINKELRKINKGFVDKIEKNSMMKPNEEVENQEEFLEKSGIQELTLKEQLFKGNKITMNFIGADEEHGNLDSLQLVVYLNGKLKYASKKGVFAPKTITQSSLKRKGWLLYCDTQKVDRLVFKSDKGFKDFIGFCTKVRDCVQIQEMYHELCYDFIKKIENTVVVEETGKVYEKVDLG